MEQFKEFAYVAGILISGSLKLEASIFSAGLCAVMKTVNKIISKTVESSIYAVFSNPQNAIVALELMTPTSPISRKL